MEAHTPAATPAAPRSAGMLDRAARLSTETRQATKTTEFWAFLVVALGILIAAAAISGNNDIAAADEFRAKDAWLYVAIVTGAYLISRGLAKSGSQEPYTDREHGDSRR